MHLRVSGCLVMAALLGGCVHVPVLAPLPKQNPANARARPGPTIPPSDFINSTGASAQIAQPKVTAGKTLPLAGTQATTSGHNVNSQANRPQSKGSNADGMGSMNNMKMGETSATTKPARDGSMK